MARPANPELRNEILKAAAFIVEDCGADCVTMRQVADRIGYSPTTIYLYFKDKSALLRATVHEACAELADACETAAVGPRALDKLRQSSRAYVVWGIMHPGHYRLMFEFSEELQFTAEDLEMVRGCLAWQQATIAEAVAAGELPSSASASGVAQDVWAALHGATSLAASGRLAPGLESADGRQVVEAATRSADGLLNALLESLAQARA